MQFAKSIYLGGVTIAPEEAKYEDSIDLGLICPLCDQPLFLVKGFSRQKGGRLESVKAHFSHYKLKGKATGDVCEERSLTKEGREFLQALTAESRGQRLTLFNRRLWDMIAWNKDFPRGLDKWLSKHHPHYRKIDDTIAQCWKEWQSPDKRKRIKEILPQAVEYIRMDVAQRVADQSGLKLNEDLFLVQKALETFRADLSNRLQWAIAEEVIDYLAQPAAQKVFANLVKLAFFDMLPEAIKRNHQISHKDIEHMITLSIGLTDWKSALEKFKKPRAGEGFGKNGTR